MRPLPTDFHRDGYTCHVRKRTGDVVLVEIGNQGVHFEVAIVQKRSARTLPGGRSIPAMESLPSDEQWGHLGWSFMDRQQAEARFDTLALERAGKSEGIPRYTPSPQIACLPATPTKRKATA